MSASVAGEDRPIVLTRAGEPLGVKPVARPRCLTVKPKREKKTIGSIESTCVSSSFKEANMIEKKALVPDRVRTIQGSFAFSTDFSATDPGRD